MAPKIQIPDELKKDLPPNKWGKILGATPIVMTVIATMLAGLASSEMTKAQYDRASAAQLQSKAGDQWGYYQAKKLRSAVARNSLDLLAATSDVSPLTADALLGAEAATVDALVKNKTMETHFSGVSLNMTPAASTSRGTPGMSLLRYAARNCSIRPRPTSVPI